MGLDPFLFWIQVKSGPYRRKYGPCVEEKKRGKKKKKGKKKVIWSVCGGEKKRGKKENVIKTFSQ